MINESKYPHATAFLKRHPDLTLDEAISYVEQLLDLELNFIKNKTSGEEMPEGRK